MVTSDWRLALGGRVHMILVDPGHGKLLRRPRTRNFRGSSSSLPPRQSRVKNKLFDGVLDRLMFIEHQRLGSHSRTS
jgi:hypothetical protein